MPSTFATGVRLHTDDQKVFVDAIKAYQDDTTATGDALNTMIKQDFPPFKLFKSTLVSHAILMRKFAEFLTSRHIQIAEHESNYLPNSLAITLFEGRQKDNALEIIANYIARDSEQLPSQSSPQSASSTPVADTLYHEKIAHNMAIRFKEESKKFSGTLGECWNEYLNEYLFAANDYNLTASQKLSYLHHLLRDNAKRFYSRHVQGICASFAEAVAIMEKEYNSFSRQSRIANHLKMIRVKDFLDKNNNMSDALEKLSAEISRLAPQGPPHYRTDMHKTEYLRTAVVGMSWAHEPLSRMQAGNMTYQELVSQLEASIQQEREEKEARLKDNLGKSSSHYDDKLSGNLPGIFWNGQPRYAKDRSWRSNRHFEKKKKSKTCWNCGNTDHLMKDCPNKEGLADTVAKKVQFYTRKRYNNENKALKQVLFEFCQQINESDSDSDEYENTDVFFGNCDEDCNKEACSDEEKELCEELWNSSMKGSENQGPSLKNALENF